MSVAIGVDNLVYSLLLTDEVDSTPTYDTPEDLPGVISINVNPNFSNETLFADDGPYEVATSLGKIDVEINQADLTLTQQAALLGHQIASGVLYRRSADTPPWVAIGFRSIKSNGSYRYTWLTKGMFAPSEQKNETKSDKINFQTPTIKGSFVKRVSDDLWEKHVDEDEAGWQASYATDWFTSVGEVGLL